MNCNTLYFTNHLCWCPTLAKTSRKNIYHTFVTHNIIRTALDFIAKWRCKFLLQFAIALVVDANLTNSVQLIWGALCVQTFSARVLKVQVGRMIIHVVSFIHKIMNTTNKTCKTAVIPEMKFGWCSLVYVQ